MLTDLLLAIAHHILVFALVGLLTMEMAFVYPGMSERDLKRLARVDAIYGGIAALIVIVGVSRVIWGLKGYEYYISNHAFWGKMVAFVIVGLLSIVPTLRILRWKRALAAGGGLPNVTEIKRLRIFIKAEAGFIVLILIFAAMMARGYGS